MSNLVLYRKYRPKTFGQVVNQEHIKTTLANAVVNNRIAHAYLFTGPRGVGKTTLARIFARAINCSALKGAEPCNECDTCKSFLDGSNLDLLEIDAASHTGVDNIRELIEHLQFAPTKSRFKVIIIDEVHMLSKGAFNALLKTLEEPPKHAVFVLATTESHKVPPTIISRTQRFDFRKVSAADLMKLLKYVCNDSKVAVTDGALMEIASAADGSFRDGLSLLDQVINFTTDKITEELAEEVLGLTPIRLTGDFLDLIIENKTSGAVDFINDLMYSGRDLYQFHKDFLEYLRKVLLAKVGAKTDFGYSSDFQAKLDAQAQSQTLDRIMKIIEVFQKAENDIRWAAVQSLPLELAAVEATGQQDGQFHQKQREAAPEISVKQTNPTPRPPSIIRKDPEPEQAVVSDGPKDLAAIIAMWPQILEKIKDYNHSLLSSLKLAQPVAMAGKELVLLFPYKFHKDAIEARKNRIIVDQVIEELCGVKLMVKPMMEKDWKAGKEEIKNDKNVVESALKIMGGEVE